MSSSDVTKGGIRGDRPGREAAPDAQPGSDARRVDGRRGPGGRRRRRRGEPSMVPDAEFTSYYGRPILKQPTWKALDIAGYLFLGGLAGASSVLAAGAQVTGRHRLATVSKAGALGAISLSAAALVHDLGRPSRFANMLRVVKVTSPMSVGSWLLAAYGPAAGLAAVTDVTGWFPRLGRAATAGAAVTGPAVACYTAVLICDTAVPAWHAGYREMPFLFAGSATAAAGGLGMLLAPVGQTSPARGAAVLGAALELSATRLMRRRLGPVAETYEEGSAGRLIRAAEILTAAGGLAGLVAGGRRAGAMLAGGALLAGSALTRFGIFEAGRASVADPKYTIEPQKGL